MLRRGRRDGTRQTTDGTATGMNRIDRIDGVLILFILYILLKMFQP